MEINCQHCGKAFTAQRSTARYCSDSCRVQAHRARKEAAKPKQRRRPLPQQYFEAAYSLRQTLERLDRQIGRLEALHDDDRFPRYKQDAREVSIIRNAVDLTEGIPERIAALCEDFTGHPLP